MDDGRERGEVLVNPSILGPNRRPIHINTWTVRDESGDVVYRTDDPVDVALFLGSRSEH